MTHIECDVRDIDGSFIYIKIDFCGPKNIKERVLDELEEMGKDIRLFDLEHDDNVSFVIKDNGILSVCKKVDCSLEEFFDYSALMNFCSDGCLREVKLLLEYEAAMNPDYEGNTPLHAASENGHADMVKLLLEHGAPPNEIDNDPINTAVSNGHTDTVKLLLEYGARMDDDEDHLNIAVGNEHIDITKLILEHKRELGYDLIGDSLHTAVKNDNIDIVELLLEYGMEMERDGAGNTPLNSAAARGHYHIAKVLLDYGADMEPNKDGETPLVSAFHNDHLCIIQLLFDHVSK